MGLDLVLSDTKELLLAVTSLVGCVSGLATGLRKMVRDHEGYGNRLLVGGLCLLVVIYLGFLLAGRAEGRESLVNVTGGEEGSDYATVVGRLNELLGSYESVCLELQAVAGLVEPGEPVVTVRFEQGEQEDGYYAVIGANERARVAAEVRAAIAAIPEAEGPVDVLVRGLSDPDDQVAYNRAASLVRGQKVRALLVEELGLEESSILVAPLGQSASPARCQGEARWECRIAQVFLVQRGGGGAQDPEALVERLRVILRTSADRGADSRATALLTINGQPHELGNHFPRGGMHFEEIAIEPAIPLGELQEMRFELGNDGDGRSPDWKVENVRIEYATGDDSFHLLRERPQLGWIGRVSEEVEGI
jgi:hypothetical protein